MTASEYCKQAGLQGTAELSRITGKPVRTLNDWFNYQPKLFRILVIGAAQFKKTFIGDNLPSNG